MGQFDVVEFIVVFVDPAHWPVYITTLIYYISPIYNCSPIGEGGRLTGQMSNC
jgi:hypothetical protein